VLGGEFVLGDLADRDALDALFSQYRFDAVFHFASFIQVGESVKEPAKYYANNVVNTLKLLDAMVAHGVGRFVFSSTAAVYGEPAYTPIDEAHPKLPINPYGKTKWMVEQILEDYDRAYGLRSIALRYFNAAGADPEGQLGERHDPETHLIPLVLQAASGRRPHISVFGRDYDTPDGTCIRDYIHVADLADAHWLALDKLMQGAGFRRLQPRQRQRFLGAAGDRYRSHRHRPRHPGGRRPAPRRRPGPAGGRECRRTQSARLAAGQGRPGDHHRGRLEVGMQGLPGEPG
jgi:UDP-glucose 4-epimerase